MTPEVAGEVGLLAEGRALRVFGGVEPRDRDLRPLGDPELPVEQPAVGRLDVDLCLLERAHVSLPTPQGTWPGAGGAGGRRSPGSAAAWPATAPSPARAYRRRSRPRPPWTPPPNGKLRPPGLRVSGLSSGG